ncbi:flavin-containing monooxygenase [Nocardia sp. NPDC056100]|uniref:flavin-containing monooxygenase n=1 Tax=Nocardia sp. NPDC056100 TaxID=3345712 RepID=UPI0035DCD5C1
MTDQDTDHPDHEVIIIGAGFGGLGVAIELKAAGITDFVILERAADIGGTWRDNVYPGAGVDVPSWNYCYSFEPNQEWGHWFAKGPELKAYADHCADKYGLRPHLRLNTTVKQAEFDEGTHRWTVDTEGLGPITARYVIFAYGGLTIPKRPDIPGLDDFAGTTMHSARWDREYDPSGARVAVIGTGSSAAQLIPELAERARTLTVFQRTPIWAVPAMDFRIPRPLRWFLKKVPQAWIPFRIASVLMIESFFLFGIRFKIPAMVRMVEWAGLALMRRQVRDPEIRRKLTPNYRFGCKFPTFSNRYYRTFSRENVELVTDPIERITPTGVVTGDGVHHEIDTLVLATGFYIYERGAAPPFPIINGAGTDMGDHFHTHRWSAYEGVTVPGWPNGFWVLGPYSVTGSYFLMVENTARHAIRCMREARRRSSTRIEITQRPHDRYFEEMVRRQSTSIFYTSNCADAHSFYFDKFGDVPLIRPATGAEAWWRARRFPLDDYTFTARESTLS